MALPELPTDAWVREVAELLLERAAEHFAEVFGDPSGGDDGLDLEAKASALPEMVAAVRKFYAHGRIWVREEAS